MNAIMAAAVLIPRSLIITNTFAMQGTNRVITTRATKPTHFVELTVLPQEEEPRRPIVAPEETDKERIRSLRREPEKADHQRARKQLEAGERAGGVEDVEDERPEHEERHGFLEVPLGACCGLDEDVADAGIRIGGTSRRKSELRPGINLDAAHPTPKMVPATTPPQMKVPSGAIEPSSARTTPSWAEHGTPRARRNVTIARSLRVGRSRVVSVAIVSQPRPRIIGRTALPFSPMTRKMRLTMTARRGRYPESSRMPKNTKNVPTTGSTIAIA